MKDVQATDRCLQPSKKNIQHLKTRNFFTFSIFVGHFGFWVRIRIHDTTSTRIFIQIPRTFPRDLEPIQDRTKTKKMLDPDQ